MFVIYSVRNKKPQLPAAVKKTNERWVLAELINKVGKHIDAV